MVCAFAGLQALCSKAVAESDIIAPLLGQTNMYGLAKAGAKIKADQPQVLQPTKQWLLCRVWATNANMWQACCSHGLHTKHIFTAPSQGHLSLEALEVGGLRWWQLRQEQLL